MNQRAIGYIRVSTAGQATDGVSLDAQTDRIRAWCDANGYTLADVFTDAGISGKRADNRPGLRRALDAACKQRAALVVYSLTAVWMKNCDMLPMPDPISRTRDPIQRDKRSNIHRLNAGAPLIRSRVAAPTPSRGIGELR